MYKLCYLPDAAPEYTEVGIWVFLFCHCEHSHSSSLWALRCSCVQWVTFYRGTNAHSNVGEHRQFLIKQLLAHGVKGECSSVLFLTAYFSRTNIVMNAVDWVLSTSECAPMGICVCEFAPWAANVCMPCLRAWRWLWTGLCMCLRKVNIIFQVFSTPLLCVWSKDSCKSSKAASRVNKCQVHSTWPLTIACWGCSNKGCDTYEWLFGIHYFCVPGTRAHRSSAWPVLL